MQIPSVRSVRPTWVGSDPSVCFSSGIPDTQEPELDDSKMDMTAKMMQGTTETQKDERWADTCRGARVRVRARTFSRHVTVREALWCVLLISADMRTS